MGKRTMDPGEIAKFDQAWAHIRDTTVPMVARYYNIMLAETGDAQVAVALTLQFQQLLFTMKKTPDGEGE